MTTVSHRDSVLDKVATWPGIRTQLTPRGATRPSSMATSPGTSTPTAGRSTFRFPTTDASQFDLRDSSRGPVSPVGCAGIQWATGGAVADFTSRRPLS